MSLVKLAGNTLAQKKLGEAIAKIDRSLANKYMEFSHGIDQISHARESAKRYGVKYKPGKDRFAYDFVGKEYAKSILPELRKNKEKLKEIAKITLTKTAIESGQRTDLPNAWKVKKGMGPNSNIPIAKGLFKQALEIPVSHLKGDKKEIDQIRALAKHIVKITKEMNAEDAKAMK